MGSMRVFVLGSCVVACLGDVRVGARKEFDTSSGNIEVRGSDVMHGIQDKKDKLQLVCTQMDGALQTIQQCVCGKVTTMFKDIKTEIVAKVADQTEQADQCVPSDVGSVFFDTAIEQIKDVFGECPASLLQEEEVVEEVPEEEGNARQDVEVDDVSDASHGLMDVRQVESWKKPNLKKAVKKAKKAAKKVVEVVPGASEAVDAAKEKLVSEAKDKIKGVLSEKGIDDFSDIMEIIAKVIASKTTNPEAQSTMRAMNDECPKQIYGKAGDAKKAIDENYDKFYNVVSPLLSGAPNSMGGFLSKLLKKVKGNLPEDTA